MAEKMSGLVNKLLLAGLGAAAITREKAEKYVKDMSSRGKFSKDEAASLINDLAKKGKQAQGEIKDLVKKNITKLLKETEMASREDVAELKKKIRDLEEKLKNK